LKGLSENIENRARGLAGNGKFLLTAPLGGRGTEPRGAIMITTGTLDLKSVTFGQHCIEYFPLVIPFYIQIDHGDPLKAGVSEETALGKGPTKVGQD